MDNVRVGGNVQWEVWGAIGNLRVGGSVQWKVEGREKVWGILTFIYITLLKLDKFIQGKKKPTRDTDGISLFKGKRNFLADLD